MPLHDWNTSANWEGVRVLWSVELLRWVKPQLPAGYRVQIASTPFLTLEGGNEVFGNIDMEEPEGETASSLLNPQKSVFVTFEGRLTAVIELISPRNKDRPISRATYLARYLGYLQTGVHCLLVDVHGGPLNYSFADALGQELEIGSPACPAPFAITYRVGEPVASGGSMIAIWSRPLTVGSALPTIPLPLTVHQAIPIDLEQTYQRAATDAYLT